MQHPLRVGVAGLGTVGLAVLRASRSSGRGSGGALRAQNRGCGGLGERGAQETRHRSLSASSGSTIRSSSPRSPDIDLFVELIGGADGAALASVEAALDAGKSVVTANKALLAKHGMRLAELAEAKGVALGFEASVAGGIPIVKTLARGTRRQCDRPRLLGF